MPDRRPLNSIEEMNVKILAKGKDTSLNPRHMQSAGPIMSARLEADVLADDNAIPIGHTPKEMDFGHQLDTA